MNWPVLSIFPKTPLNGTDSIHSYLIFPFSVLYKANLASSQALPKFSKVPMCLDALIFWLLCGVSQEQFLCATLEAAISDLCPREGETGFSLGWKGRLPTPVSCIRVAELQILSHHSLLASLLLTYHCSSSSQGPLLRR